MESEPEKKGKITFIRNKNDLEKFLNSKGHLNKEKIIETIKKKKQERYTPISDTIIEQGLQDNVTLNSINPSEINIHESILQDPLTGNNKTNNINLDYGNNLNDTIKTGFESVADTKSNLNEFGKIFS